MLRALLRSATPAVIALGAATSVLAQDAAGHLDVMSAVNGVWAYDAGEVDRPGDYTCADRPEVLLIIDGGARIASKRPGDAEVRYGLILDVRNDFPLGAALSIVWQDAPRNDAGDPIASILVMEDQDAFSWVRGDDLIAFQEGEGELARSPRRMRCPAETAALAAAPDAG